MKKNYRIGYTGGGSGGHIFPLLAVSDQVSRICNTSQISHTDYYFGTPEPYQAEFASRGIIVKSISPVKLRRYFSLQNFIDFIKFPFVIVQALWKLFWVMPDVVFSKGGTGALPVVIAAWFYRIPVMIHDSDSVPGLTNVLSARFATRVGISFSEASRYFSGPNVALVGNPVNPLLLEKNDITHEQAKRVFGFDPQTPLILVLGGSQGAQRINEFLLDIAPQLVTKFQILHQVGVANFDAVKYELDVATNDQLRVQRDRYKIVDFFNKNLRDALTAADIIVTRGGSASLFEIALYGKPAVIIPLKESARNHQFLNAYEYAHKGGGIIIEEDNLKPTIFTEQIEKILTHPEIYDSMAQSAREFSKPMAALLIAQEIVRMFLNEK